MSTPLAWNLTEEQFRLFPTTEIAKIYHECVVLAVRSMIKGRPDAAAHYFSVAATCRRIAAEKFGKMDKGHSTAIHVVERERAHILAHKSGAPFRFYNRCIVAEAEAAGVKVPQRMKPK